MLRITTRRISAAALRVLRWAGLVAAADPCTCGRKDPQPRSAARGFDATASYVLAF